MNLVEGACSFLGGGKLFFCAWQRMFLVCLFEGFNVVLVFSQTLGRWELALISINYVGRASARLRIELLELLGACTKG